MHSYNAKPHDLKFFLYAFCQYSLVKLSVLLPNPAFGYMTMTYLKKLQNYYAKMLEAKCSAVNID